MSEIICRWFTGSKNYCGDTDHVGGQKPFSFIELTLFKCTGNNLNVKLWKGKRFYATYPCDAAFMTRQYVNRLLAGKWISEAINLRVHEALSDLLNDVFGPNTALFQRWEEDKFSTRNSWRATDTDCKILYALPGGPNKDRTTVNT